MMEEQLKNGYKVKSRNEMKTINVVFVSDELVGETIVTRKEYDRAMRQKVKTETEKPKAQESEMPSPSSSKKRKASEGEQDANRKKLKVVDDVELALAALEQDDEEENLGKKDPTKKDSGKRDSTKKDSGKKDTGKKDQSKRDSTRKDSSKRDSSKKDSDKKDANKKDSGENSGGNEGSEKEGGGKEDAGKACVEQLRKLMGDEKGASSSSDSKNEILTLKSFINGEGTSRMEDRGPETSRAKPDQGKVVKKKVITPYSLRKRVIRDIKKIQRILENSDDEDNDISSSESEFLDSSEESEIEENNGKPPGAGSSMCVNYFEAQSFRRNITSNNTLRILKNPTLNQKELNKIVKKFKLSPGHRGAIKSLINESVMSFNKWDFLLRNGFNLLLYGLGCKREIVNNFVERFAKKHPLIVVNGFFPDVSVRDVTEKICQVLKIGSAKIDVTPEINRKLKEYHVEIYIVVNNIDGLMLRNKRTQTILSQYAKMEGIHMIATIDHINAPLMWDKSTFSEFNWIWFDCTTFLNYTDEVVYEGNIMLQNSGKLTLSSLRNVYNSLTKNSRSIFLLIVKRELNCPAGARKGISFKELYQSCRRELLISSDGALRSLLKEFVDHAILKQKRTPDGEEVFVVTVENNILKQFVEDQEDR